MQAPQDYRDAHEDLFKRMCFWEYAGFFHLGMKTRDEKNAIIQHGTMALIRKSALAEVGGWARVVHHRGCRTGPAPVRERAIARSIPRRATARA